MSMKEKVPTRVESGTCNFCSAPCSSCMHFNRSISFSESNMEGIYSFNNFLHKDSHSFVDSVVQSRACGKSASEMCASASSSHDSYNENAESKACLTPTLTEDTSEAVKIPLRESQCDVDKLLSKGCNVPAHHFTSFIRTDEEKSSECLGDNMLGLNVARCPNSGQFHFNFDAVKKGADPIGIINYNNLPLTGVNEALFDASLDDKVSETLLERPESASLDLEVSKDRTLASSIVDDLREMSVCVENTSLGICSSKVESSTAPTLDACSDVRPEACDVASLCRNGPFSESKLGKDSAATTSNVGNSNIANSNSSHEDATSDGIFDVQTQSLPEGEKSGSDEIEEHDVKVCDICGDAGREESLAICSRCSDGAEHTYCMRIMLKKVPEDEWLCEECKLKESENRRMNKTEFGPKISRIPSFKETTENSDIPSDAKDLHKLGGRTISKGSKNGEKDVHFMYKKQANQLDTRPATGKRPCEVASLSMEMGSPRKKAALLQESIFRPLDPGKPKANNVSAVSSSKVQKSVGPNLLKNLVPQAPHGSFFRSSSLNNGSSVSGKVRQLTGNIPAMQNINKGTSPRDTRKDGLVRSTRKTLPLGRPSSVFSNPVATNKAQCLNSPLSDDPIGVKSRKDGEFLEKKKNFSERPLVIPIASTTGIPSKSDVKLDLLGTSKVLDSTIDSRCSLRRSYSCIVKPQTRHSDSESPKQLQIAKENIQAPIMATPSPRIPRGSAQALYSAVHAEKPRDFSLLGNFGLAGQASRKILHCQRCNEVGRAAHICPANKLRAPVLSDISSKEWTGKSDNKYEQKIAMLSEQRADFSVSNDYLPLESAITKSRPVLDSSRIKGSMDIVHENACEQLDVKPALEPEQAAFFSSKLLRLTVIPELDYIWQGNFEVSRNGKMDICAGVQAHLSSCVSPKVLPLVDKFPDGIVKLDEVSRSHAWPSQFERASPRDDHIALFFFARDLESYEKHYQKLLDNMLKNDIALKGNIGGVELLIFASDKLPMNSQRWNNMFFLWGVFRGRNPLESTNDTQEKSCESVLNKGLLIPQPSSPVPPFISVSPFSGCIPQPSSPVPPFFAENNPIIFDNKSAKENVMGLEKERDLGPEKEDDFNKDYLNMVSPVILPSSENGTRTDGSVNSCADSNLQEPVLLSSSQTEKKSISDELENRNDQKPQKEETDLGSVLLPAQCILSKQGLSDKIVVKEKTMMETQVLVKREIVLDLNEAEDPTEMDCQDREEPTCSSKCQWSCSLDTFSRASGELLNLNGMSFNEEVGHKKIKLSSFIEDELDFCGSSLSSQTRQRSASLPLGDVFFHEAKISNSMTRTNERHLLSLGLSPARDTKAENLTYILSSDDEDSPPESTIPDLELALGGRKGTSSRKDQVVEEDVPLSLSLAFPTVVEGPPGNSCKSFYPVEN